MATGKIFHQVQCLISTTVSTACSNTKTKYDKIIIIMLYVKVYGFSSIEKDVGASSMSNQVVCIRGTCHMSVMTIPTHKPPTVCSQHTGSQA